MVYNPSNLSATSLNEFFASKTFYRGLFTTFLPPASNEKGPKEKKIMAQLLDDSSSVSTPAKNKRNNNNKTIFMTIVFTQRLFIDDLQFRKTLPGDDFRVNAKEKSANLRYFLLIGVLH